MSNASSSAPFAKTTAITMIAPDALRCSKTQMGYGYWRTLCGARRYPAREAIKPRDIAGALTNMVLVKVVDGGDDFEFRIVGDHAGRGYTSDINNRLFSDVADEMPRAVANWFHLFRIVVAKGSPLAANAVTGFDAPDLNFSEAEAVLLPLGATDDQVDHIVTFIQHTLRS